MKDFILKNLASMVQYFPKTILGLRYYRWTKKKVNWKKPKDLQQYVFAQYLKKYFNNDLQEYANLTDKIKVREFVKNRIGEKYLTRLYGTWENPEEIDFSCLPEKFVLKTNNGCGTNLIIKDKSKDLNIENAKSNLKKWLKFPYGAISGQPHYSLIKPAVLAESFLEQSKNKESLPNDYKFFCFNGEPKFILYYEDRKVNGHLTKNMVFDLHWNPLPDKVKRPTENIAPKPESLSEMIEIARKLSEGFEFVRVDLYEINSNPIFGEMTFTPDMIINFTPDFLDIKNY